MATSPLAVRDSREACTVSSGMLSAKAVSSTVTGAKQPRCLRTTESTAAESTPAGGVHLEKYQRLFSVMPVRVMRYMDSSFLTDLNTTSSETSTWE